MAKKKAKSSDFTGFSTWETNDYIRECPNIVRWNARLAIEWMNMVRDGIWGEGETEMYNDSANRINNFLDKLETYRYYDKYDTWDMDKVQRLELLSNHN
jgi:hypothetical protein